jgi:hypothetical protein
MDMRNFYIIKPYKANPYGDENLGGKGNKNQFRFRFRHLWTLIVQKSQTEMKKISSDVSNLALPMEIKNISVGNFAPARI